MAALPRYVHQIILYVFAVVSVSANSLLLLFVTHRSSRHLGNYRVLLCSFAIIDVTISLLHAFILPVFVQSDNGFVIFALNTLYLPEKLGFALNELYIILYFEHSCANHAIQNFLDYFNGSASTPVPFKATFTAALLINAALSMMILYDCWLIYPEIPENFFAQKLKLDYDIDLYAVPPPNVIPVHYVHAPGFGGGPNWNSILSMLNCGAFATATNATCGLLITRAVKQKTMPATFRRMQVQLLRALIVQFSIPVACCVVPFFLIVCLPATNLSVRHLATVMGFIVSAFPVIDPICVILAYSRFRSLITGFRRRR